MTNVKTLIVTAAIAGVTALAACGSTLPANGTQADRTSRALRSNPKPDPEHPCITCR